MGATMPDKRLFLPSSQSLVTGGGDCNFKQKTAMQGFKEHEKTRKLDTNNGS